MIRSKTIASVALGADPIDTGSRLELFVDDFLIDTMHGVRRRLQHPTPREIALDLDKPWEGNESIDDTVFRDGEIVRMYYRGRQVNYRRTVGWRWQPRLRFPSRLS